MTKLPPSYFVQFLQEIYPCHTPISVQVSHRKTKKHKGSYFVGQNRMIIYDHWGDDNVCKEIAIHEYSHHLHHTEVEWQNNYANKAHGQHFWQIYGVLMVLAKAKGLYDDSYLAPIMRKPLYD